MTDGRRKELAEREADALCPWWTDGVHFYKTHFRRVDDAHFLESKRCYCGKVVSPALVVHASRSSDETTRGKAE